jgi:hypothetical protein
MLKIIKNLTKNVEYGLDSLKFCSLVVKNYKITSKLHCLPFSKPRGVSLYGSTKGYFKSHSLKSPPKSGKFLLQISNTLALNKAHFTSQGESLYMGPPSGISRPIHREYHQNWVNLNCKVQTPFA